jgi:3-methyladenine DNA glycosylase AlkD
LENTTKDKHILNTYYQHAHMISESLTQLFEDVKKSANKDRAFQTKSFFKTGPGEYGEGDAFIGISTPDCRSLAKKYSLPYSDIHILLNREENELRLIGLLMLVDRYEREASAVYKFTLEHRYASNNWNLVDSVAWQIVGRYLLDKPRDILYKLVHSKNMWDRRIAIVATYAFIKENEFDDTIAIAKILLNDSQDLIHKAVGWMLREVGKRDKRVLLNFLANHANEMPSIMRSYAIEKLSPTLRKTIQKQVASFKKEKK